MPFANKVKRVRNFAFPLRHARRAGVYYVNVSEATEPPARAIGFYTDSRGDAPTEEAFFSLRLELANNAISDTRLSWTRGYFTDNNGDGDTLQPIIARLPRGRGFLAGWTMGAGMCASLERHVYDDERDAAFAAHCVAEFAAEAEREYQATQELEA